MTEEVKDYSQIFRPYGSLLEREGGLEMSIGGQQLNTSTPYNNAVPGANGITEDTPVKNEGAMSDLWINNFIRSSNWQPQKSGFYLDGITGYAEFSNVVLSGGLKAKSGTIGGWTIGATDLSITDQGRTVSLSSTTPHIIAGPTGAPAFSVDINGHLIASSVTITGGTLNIGGSFQVNANGGLLATSATITGQVTATFLHATVSGTIANFTITNAGLTGGLMRTATTGRRIQMNGSTNAFEFLDETGTVFSDLKADYVEGVETMTLFNSEGAGLLVEADQGASVFTGVQIGSRGGFIGTAGSATQSYLDITATEYNDGVGSLVITSSNSRRPLIQLINLLPTSSVGLESGTLWNNGGVVNIVS